MIYNGRRLMADDTRRWMKWTNDGYDSWYTFSKLPAGTYTFKFGGLKKPKYPGNEMPWAIVGYASEKALTIK